MPSRTDICPRFDEDAARRTVQAAEDAWNTRDSDGARLEVYALTGADGHGRPPAGDAPGCGLSG